MIEENTPMLNPVQNEEQEEQEELQDINVADVDYDRYQKIIAALDDKTLNQFMAGLVGLSDLYKAANTAPLTVAADVPRIMDYYAIELLLLLKNINIIN